MGSRFFRKKKAKVDIASPLPFDHLEGVDRKGRVVAVDFIGSNAEMRNAIQRDPDHLEALLRSCARWGGSLKRRAIGRTKQHFIQRVDFEKLDSQVDMPKVNRIKGAAIKSDCFLQRSTP